MVFEKCDNLHLVHFAGGHSKNHGREFIIISGQLLTVEVQKHCGGHSTDPFVAINKWMVFNQVEEICRRHIDHSRMQIRSTESR